MSERTLIAIPVKSFEAAKERLAPSLTGNARRRLGSALAARTAWIARDAGADVIVIAGSADVAAWATRTGFPSLVQPESRPGLNGAARLAMEAAVERRQRGFVLHADLPWASAAALRAALAIPGAVIAPSHDGGTALLGGVEPDFGFAYGPSSFHRHLRAAPGMSVTTSPMLALDLDQPIDLERALASPVGAWLRRYALDASGGPSDA